MIHQASKCRAITVTWRNGTKVRRAWLSATPHRTRGPAVPLAPNSCAISVVRPTQRSETVQASSTEQKSFDHLQREQLVNLRGVVTSAAEMRRDHLHHCRSVQVGR